jgi:BirA family transcriptional regulator, biotin operon repressor / biotin---[acetyl-CoA-carboxylase] ligase
MEEIPGVKQVLRFESTESTQKVARKLAEEGAAEWTLVWAGAQTEGKGRMGRKWASGPGGLYVSLILRPKMAPKRLAELSLISADSVARVVNDFTGLKTTVKPPNDVLVQGPNEQEFKKVCGILIEASGGAEHIDWIVLGIGLNVNNKVPKTLKDAASLAALSGREFDVEEVLRLVIASFIQKYQAFLTASNGHIERPTVAPPPEQAG